MSSSLPLSAYLLVHPERFPSNDSEAIGPHLPEGASLQDFDERYGQGIGARAAGCARRVVLLDGSGQECLEEEAEWGDEPELTVGVAAEGWEIVAAEPHEVGHAVRRAFKGHEGPILVGGFARHDCVARAVKALRNLGLDVALDEEATLPLSPEGAASYLG